MTNDRPTIEAKLIGDLPSPDPSAAVWQTAKSAQLDSYWSGDPAPAARKAEARILWSDEALHVRFLCNQREPLIVHEQPQLQQKTMGLWDRDVCEIFIAPNPNTIERYFEFEAAPTGEWLDVAIRWSARKRESDWEFKSGMTTATHIGTSFLLTAIRIPWSDSIPRPQKGERWRINLFRCVGQDPDRGYVAWQPTMTPQPSFHVPQVFGWLEFG